MAEAKIKKKIERALNLIKKASKMAASVGQVIEVCYSGGKDSDVILELVRMANVPYRAIYKNTTIDPPGTIAHVKENNVEIIEPKDSFLQIISKAGFPNRVHRFCCGKLKDYKILDYAILGIRLCESVSRRKRYSRYREPEICKVYTKTKKVRQYYPILDWTNENLLEFITQRNIKLHPLYYKEDGTIDITKRLGCLCCPLQGKVKRRHDFEEHPNMVKLYCKGGERFLSTHPNSVKHRFGDVYGMFVRDVFYDDDDKFNKDMGGLWGMDCKAFLEQKYNIKLK